jgi:hypothetical protein
MHPLKKLLNDMKTNQKHKFDRSNDIALGSNTLKKK